MPESSARSGLALCTVESVRVHVLTGQHVVLLQPKDSDRLVPIWIGADQAHSIATRIAGIPSDRPLTHDLMMSMLAAAGAEITRVVVKDLVTDASGQGSVFHGSVFLQVGEREVEIDSRASDAIALAVRCDARILVADTVIDRSSIAASGRSRRPASSGSSVSSSRASPTSRTRATADPTRGGVLIDPAIWPLGTSADRRGHLRVGGVDLVGLADRLGTPLYVYEAATIRDAYRRYLAAFAPMRPVRVSYAIKACALRGVASILARAGADASASSLGELLAAKRAGFLPARTQLHGNAKTDDELRAALRLGVGRIVIDGADEIDRLRLLVARRARPQPVWLRVSPGIAADTHPHLRTGMLDSKFGAPIAGGDALAQCRAIVATKNLSLVGIHAHLGTQLHEAERYRELGEALAALARDVTRATGAKIKEIGVGGGLAIPLRSDDPVLDLAAYARAISEPIRADAALGKVALYLEPGRSLVGRAGVAVYRVVGTKRVTGVRTFVSVDGGMGDNIRPALYDATYTAVLAGRVAAAPTEHVAIAGKYCESGDLLIRDVALPTAEPGDVLAIPAAGAYSVAMASNYNHHPRPAVALIDDGRTKVIRKRETHADIWRLER